MAKAYIEDPRCGRCFEYFIVTEHPSKEDPSVGYVTYDCPRCGNFIRLYPDHNFKLDLPKKQRKAKSNLDTEHQKEGRNRQEKVCK
jgi:hypothetical protein